MAKKMPRPLVALSASAIAAVYLAGFAVTHAADTAMGASAPSGGMPAVAASSSVATSGAGGPVGDSLPRRHVFRNGYQPTRRRQCVGDHFGGADLERLH